MMKKNGFISVTIVYSYLILFLFLMLAIINAYNQKNKYLEVINEQINIDLSTPAKLGITILEALVENIGEPIQYTTSASATTGGFYYTTNASATENGERVYFLRGNIGNNFVLFADKCWRIVRTNEDGSTKLVYAGPHVDGDCYNKLTTAMVTTTQFNTANANNMYIGYKYGSGTTSYDLAHANTNNSAIKTALETWFEENIVELGYDIEKQVANTIYCNDRSLQSGTGYSTTATTFKGNNRLSTNTPIYACTNNNDEFTLSSDEGGKETFGNNGLKYPIGLLTMDEYMYAGGSTGTNTSYFLHNNFNVWTMTPSRYNSGAYNYITNSNGALAESIVTTSNYLVPVISLKESALVESGTGINTDPFVIRKEE